MRSVVIAIAAFVITSAIGCTTLTPQQKNEINLANAQAQVDAAKAAAQAKAQQAAIEAKAKVDAANAEANPILHPIAHANAVVKKAEKPLRKIILISFLATCLSVGLLFTQLSAVSKIALPLSLTTLILSGFGIVTLPLWPAAGLVVMVVLLIAGIYELYHYRAKIAAELESAVTAPAELMGHSPETAPPK